MREFLVTNKWMIIRLLVLAIVFLLVVTYINGRSIYKEKTRMIEERNSSISKI